MLLTHDAAASASPRLPQLMSGGRGSVNSFFQFECMCFCPYRDLYRPSFIVQSAVSETQLLSAGYFFLLFCRDRKIPPKCKGAHLNWEFKFWICLVKHLS